MQQLMKNSRIIKYGILSLLLAGWISCGEQNAALPKEELAETIPETPEREPYAVVAIENLQTRLRILDPKNTSRENLWDSDPQNVILYYLPTPHDTYFGYADADGQTFLCEVINFPGAALQWEGEFSRTTEKGTVTEVNIQMNGIIRLYTDSAGGKYGTLELMSLEPSGTGSKEPVNLQSGVLYMETYPIRGRTQVNFLDKDTLEITERWNYGGVERVRTLKRRYEIQDNNTVSIEDGLMYELYFRVTSDSKFEIDCFYPLFIAGDPRIGNPPIMTFEKVEEGEYAVVEIENMQTRLRVLDPKNLSNSDRENVWFSDPENVIVHYLSAPYDTYFGYADADGQTLLCEVINFSGAALQWEGEFSRTTGLGGTVTEVNVQMSGTVRLYIDKRKGKYGTLELKSLEPSGSGSGEPVELQLGVYTEKFPIYGRTQINFIDKNTMEIRFYDGEIVKTLKCGYEIQGDKYTINIGNGDGYFRVISDSKFEMDYLYSVVGDGRPTPIMTFAKENVSDN
jgi:hypothetical protein